MGSTLCILTSLFLTFVGLFLIEREYPKVEYKETQN